MLPIKAVSQSMNDVSLIKVQHHLILFSQFTLLLLHLQKRW